MKTKDREVRTPIKSGVEIRCTGGVGSFCPASLLTYNGCYYYHFFYFHLIGLIHNQRDRKKSLKIPK